MLFCYPNCLEEISLYFNIKLINICRDIKFCESIFPLHNFRNSNMNPNLFLPIYYDHQHSYTYTHISNPTNSSTMPLYIPLRMFSRVPRKIVHLNDYIIISPLLHTLKIVVILLLIFALVMISQLLR